MQTSNLYHQDTADIHERYQFPLRIQRDANHSSIFSHKQNVT